VFKLYDVRPIRKHVLLLTAFIRASNIRWRNRSKSCRKWKYLDRLLEDTLCFTR